MFNDFINFVKDLYNTDDFIPLHEPRFIGNEKSMLRPLIQHLYLVLENM